MINIHTRSIEDIRQYSAGEAVMLSGSIVTMRDRALANIEAGSGFPGHITGAVVYHAGPTNPNEEGMRACGPTTSSRMDKYLPMLFENDVFVTIGKGRTNTVIHKKYRAVYLAALGGCGALYGSRIKNIKTLLYSELGSEAVYAMEIENYPLILAIDSKGNSIYKNRSYNE
ncbi:MAG: FumA C-terminus/TtdB family hydratase beta subunit [candidate division WOR-3 bacterium]|nr:FumA C-terminus/TtdB family hydratase beta subunit [candidate division WOR-3 bacterium]